MKTNKLVLVAFVVWCQIVGNTTAQECECDDIPPPNTDPDGPPHNCMEQKLWGKCQADWMFANGYCGISCGWCSCGGAPSEEMSTIVFKSSEADTAIKKTAPIKCSKECSDVAPNQDYTCQEQASFGKCNALWMVNGGFCDAACGRCKMCDEQEAESPSFPIPSSEDCDDISPSEQLSCEEQKEFDKCGRSWMLEGGYCKKTCGLCNITAPKQVMKEAPVSKKRKKNVKKESETQAEGGEDEEEKAAKVRQDMQKLLAQNSEMEYMEALGFELSRSAIRDALKADSLAIPASNMAVQSLDSPIFEKAESIDNIQVTGEREPASEDIRQEDVPRKTQNKAPAVENLIQDVSVAAAAPILTVFGAGALKELAQVPEIVDTFGDTATGLDVKTGLADHEDTAAVTVDESLAQQQRESINADVKENQPQAPQTMSSPVPEQDDLEVKGGDKKRQCKETIIEQVSVHPDLSLLSSILQEIDLNGILTGIGSPVTLLAPDNRSLNAFLDSANINLTTALNQNSPMLNSLKHLILYHLLDMPFDGETMQHIAIANTKLGSDFPIFVEGSGSDKIILEGMHSVGEISIKNAIEACGSYVHVIQGVLMPYQNFQHIPTHNVEVHPFLSPPPPPPSPPTPSPIPPPSPKPIPSPACHYATPLEILREHEEVSIFVDIMNKVGLLKRLELSNEPATLFVPLNEAVIAVASQLGTNEENLLNDFLSSGNTQVVNNILNYHIVSGERVGAADLDEDKPLQTLQGAMLFPEESGTAAAAFIQGVGSTARIVQGNVDGGACQVSVHFVDSMLLPFTSGSATFNSTIKSIIDCQDELLPGVPSCDDVVQAGLCDDSGVQEGGYCMKACGHCTAAQELKMDSIVLESGYNRASTSVKQSTKKEENECKNLQQLLVDNWELSIFRSLLDDNVKGMLEERDGPVTIFAPSDSAFRQLLEMPNNKSLQGSISNVVNLLSYHTVDGLFASQNLKDGEILSTLSTQESGDAKQLTIRRTTDNSVMIQGAGSQAKMTSSDILSCQGVIHIVDNVLLPSAFPTN